MNAATLFQFSVQFWPQFSILSSQEWHLMWCSAALAHLLQGLICFAFPVVAGAWVNVAFLSAWNRLVILLEPLVSTRQFCPKNNCSLDILFIFYFLFFLTIVIRQLFSWRDLEMYVEKDFAVNLLCSLFSLITLTHHLWFLKFKQQICQHLHTLFLVPSFLISVTFTIDFGIDLQKCRSQLILDL